jgi:hypothetical protein
LTPLGKVKSLFEKTLGPSQTLAIEFDKVAEFGAHFKPDFEDFGLGRMEKKNDIDRGKRNDDGMR